MCFNLVSINLIVCIDASIAKHNVLLRRSFWTTYTAHSLLILAVNVRPRMLASDRAAIRIFRRSISCVRAVDVGLLGGPPWSLVDEVGGWWDWSTLKIAQ